MIEAICFSLIKIYFSGGGGGGGGGRRRNAKSHPSISQHCKKKNLDLIKYLVKNKNLKILLGMNGFKLHNMMEDKKDFEQR